MPVFPQFEWINYFGGPRDGEKTAMSDGVREIMHGGYYQAEVIEAPLVDGVGSHIRLLKRVAVWHATLTPEV